MKKTLPTVENQSAFVTETGFHRHAVRVTKQGIKKRLKDTTLQRRPAVGAL